MRYVENEGALFRVAGPSNAFPDEVWNAGEKKFVPYKGEVPKPQGWGQEIDEAEASEIMGGRVALLVPIREAMAAVIGAANEVPDAVHLLSFR